MNAKIQLTNVKQSVDEKSHWEEAITYFYWNQSHRYYMVTSILDKQEEMSNQKRNRQKMKKV